MADQDQALERLRALVWTDEHLAARLAGIENLEVFAGEAACAAGAHGIRLDPRAIAAAAPSDPALARLHLPLPATADRWPGSHWLPVHVGVFAPLPFVVWAHAGAAPLQGALEQRALVEMANRPFNRLFLQRMALAGFVAGAAANEAPAPAGFLFHMSRCGSTLAARMLAAVEGSLVVSELPPVNDALLLAHVTPHLIAAQRIGIVRAILSAYGRTHANAAAPWFVRFDAWAALALPLVRAAYPDTPFVLLHRDPADVLASHAASPGRDLVSGIMAQQVWQIDGAGQMPTEELTAIALGRICRSAADHLCDARAAAVGYRDLPDAVWTTILPHFGIACDDALRRRMQSVASRDSRAPESVPFSPRAGIRPEDRQRLEALVSRHVAEAYRRLPTASQSSS
jgi:hypothetical protein